MFYQESFYIQRLKNTKKSKKSKKNQKKIKKIKANCFETRGPEEDFYDSTHGWTNNVVEILQREVSWARVPEIVLQNDPALFRPKSKKMTGNSMITVNSR